MPGVEGGAFLLSVSRDSTDVRWVSPIRKNLAREWARPRVLGGLLPGVLAPEAALPCF